MKANEIMSKASGALNKIGFGLKKRSPEILVAVGVVGTVVSAVMACKATTKINTILDETKEQLDKIHEYAGNPDVAEKYNMLRRWGLGFCPSAAFWHPTISSGNAIWQSQQLWRQLPRTLKITATVL